MTPETKKAFGVFVVGGLFALAYTYVLAAPLEKAEEKVSEVLP